MTSEQLKERIQKAEQKIQKKSDTIIKKQKWIESGKKDEYEIKWLQDDIKRLGKEIAESQKTLERYQKQLTGEIERENSYITEIPDSMKQMQKELTDKWNEWDFNRRDELKKAYDEMKYSDFINKYKYTGYEQMRESDEDIKKRNEKDAKMLIIDLYNRIKAITGEVIDWSNITCSGALNGTVTGKEGRAKVETILAGGYNIQRLHIRVLVHSI